MIQAATIIIPAKNEVDSLKITLPFIEIVSSRVSQIVVVVDDYEDSTLTLRDSFRVKNLDIDFVVNLGKGIANALRTGVIASRNELILICMADEIIPLLSIDRFFEALDSGAQFVSATRYSKGGRRFGGSKLGSLLSRVANFIFRKLFRSKLSDLTTGMKAFKKSNWNLLEKNIDGFGWSPALALSRNAIQNQFFIREIPVISLDRPAGGSSSFDVNNWLKAYIKVAWDFRKFND